MKTYASKNNAIEIWNDYESGEICLLSLPMLPNDIQYYFLDTIIKQVSSVILYDMINPQRSNPFIDVYSIGEDNTFYYALIHKLKKFNLDATKIYFTVMENSHTLILLIR